MRDSGGDMADHERMRAPLEPANRPQAFRGTGRVFGSLRQDVVLATIVLLAIALMLVPVPTAVVDLLLAANLALGLVMLSSVVLLADPLRLAAFPSLLIIATLVRLAANVSTTRLILGGADGGAVVRAFGNVVFADSVVVGLVVFALITVIQFVVIARGAERIAEVTARFMLDALPGKQQAIDADVRAGAIDRHEASRRRARLATESQFFGSMDGAMKFIKGDAIATVIVVMINLLGGMIVALGQQGMSLGEAAATYSVLSIGEGLAAQVPALMAAAAAGILVARRARDGSATRDDGALGFDLFSQLGATPAALVVSGLVLLLLAVLPGMPMAPFAILAIVCLLAAYGRKLWQPRRAHIAVSQRLWDGLTVPSGHAEGVLPWPVDAHHEPAGGEAIYVVLGAQVASNLTATTLGPELAALGLMRERVSQRLGFALPPIVLIAPSANAAVALPPISLASDEICLVWRGVARSWQRVSFADDPKGVADALALGLLEAAHTLITSDVARAWCVAFAATPHRAALIGEVVPARASLAEITELLRELAREQVGVADLEAILRAIATTPASDGSEMLRLARIRLTLSDQITQSVAEGQVVAAWHIDPLAEDAIRGAITQRGAQAHLALTPELASELVEATKRALAGQDAVPFSSQTILVPGDIRYHVRALLAPELPHVAVVAHGELRPGAIVVPRGQIAI
ncbi:MAG: FHIPEP family type III secretion protein [Myxococcales bacterium]|nr:FHIPEP family type III secretion protein [Myxococcales bacterium]